MYNFTYDAQFRRYLIQITRIFNGFQYQSTGSSGITYTTVPSIYGLNNTQAASILTKNSENSTLTVPLFVTYPIDVTPSSERRMNPTFIKRNQVTERAIDASGNYTNTAGARYTVETMMPVPIDLRVKVELITSNQSQMYQLLEQVITLFNPEVEIQTSTNALDWTAISYAKLEDIDISPVTTVMPSSSSYNSIAFTIYVPVWINPPARVLQQKLIQEVIINIDADGGTLPEPGELLTSTVVTPGNYSINVQATETASNTYNITLTNGDIVEGLDYDYNWNLLLGKYGTVSSTSKIYLLQEITGLDNNDVYIGTIESISDDGKTLVWNLDTTSLPQQKYPNNIINGIIDPTVTYPGNGLPTPVDGVKYLLLGDISSSGLWGTITYNKIATQAKENDIIQWSASTSSWSIYAKSNTLEDMTHYTVQSSTGDQYITYDNGSWRLTLDAEYNKGFWRIKL